MQFASNSSVSLICYFMFFLVLDCDCHIYIITVWLNKCILSIISFTDDGMKSTFGGVILNIHCKDYGNVCLQIVLWFRFDQKYLNGCICAHICHMWYMHNTHDYSWNEHLVSLMFLFASNFKSIFNKLPL